MDTNSAYQTQLAKIQRKHLDNELATHEELIRLVYLNACHHLSKPNLTEKERKAHQQTKEAAQRMLR